MQCLLLIMSFHLIQNAMAEEPILPRCANLTGQIWIWRTKSVLSASCAHKHTHKHITLRKTQLELIHFHHPLS